MQQLVYNEAPYIILYYDSELHAYRTDKFSGWTNQPPDNGTPLFGYGSIGYTVLTDAKAQPSAPPSEAPPAASAGASPAASASPSPSPTSSSDSTVPLVIGAVALIAVIAVGLVVMRGRRGSVEEE